MQEDTFDIGLNARARSGPLAASVEAGASAGLGGLALDSAISVSSAVGVIVVLVLLWLADKRRWV